MNLRTFWYTLLLLIAPLLLSGQNGWGLTPGSSYGFSDHSLAISWRVPGPEFFAPNTGNRLSPTYLPVVLRYAYLSQEQHLLGVDFGGSIANNLLVVDPNGTILERRNGFIPAARFSYRWLPAGGTASVVQPYLGAGTEATAGIFELPPEGRIFGLSLGLQAMAGLRIQADMGLFFEIEVPYTFLRLAQLRWPDGRRTFNMLTGGIDMRNQMWPAVGVGFSW